MNNKRPLLSDTLIRELFVCNLSICLSSTFPNVNVSFLLNPSLGLKMGEK